MNRHNAPPVVYPLGRSYFLGCLLLGIWLAGLCAVFLWWYVTRQQDWRLVLAILSVLLAGISARVSWSRLPDGQLTWDGDVWRWESAGYQAGIAEYELSVVADIQHSLLLRLQNKARASLWLWVEKTAMPERWMDLRRAVYSPHKRPSALSIHDFPAAELSAFSSPAVAIATAKPSVNVSRENP